MTEEYVNLQEMSLYADTPVYRIADDFVDNEPVAQAELAQMTVSALRQLYTVKREKIVFGFLRRPVLPEASDVVYTVDQAHVNRLTDISTKFYSTPAYWWAIASANSIIDVHAKIVQGTRLRIPAQNRIEGT